MGCLTKELFKDVLVYNKSEIGAMGPNGMMTFYEKLKRFGVRQRELQE